MGAIATINIIASGGLPAGSFFMPKPKELPLSA
jgi:hypothetical protein